MTQAQKIVEQEVANMLVRVTDCPRGGVTFGLYPFEAIPPANKKRVFSGPVDPEAMSAQCRALADQIDALVRARTPQKEQQSKKDTEAPIGT